MQFGHILHCNLALLGFEPALDLEPDFLLQKQPSSLIDALLYFVFTKYSAKEAHKRFKGCWPILERIGNREFRLACFKWAEDLRNAKEFPPEMPLRRSFFDDGYGERFVEVLAWISSHALRQHLEYEISNLDERPFDFGLLTSHNPEPDLIESLKPHIQKGHEKFQELARVHLIQKSKYEAIEKALSNSISSSEEVVTTNQDKILGEIMQRTDKSVDLFEASEKFLQSTMSVCQLDVQDDRQALRDQLEGIILEKNRTVAQNQELSKTLEGLMESINMSKFTKSTVPPIPRKIEDSLVDRLLSQELLLDESMRQNPSAMESNFIDCIDDSFLVE